MMIPWEVLKMSVKDLLEKKKDQKNVNQPKAENKPDEKVEVPAKVEAKEHTIETSGVQVTEDVLKDMDEETVALLVAYQQAVKSGDFSTVQEVAKEIAGDEEQREYTEDLLIGRKKVSDYIPSAEARLSQFKKLVIKARGKSCQTALDLSQIIIRNHPVKVQAIHVDTEWVERKESDSSRQVLRLNKKVNLQTLARIITKKVENKKMPLTTLVIEVA